MVSDYNDDFQVTWNDAPAAEHTWRWPKDHFPRPLTPLSQGILKEVTPSHTVFVNGYLFAYTDRWPPVPPLEVLKRGAFEVWTNTYAPRAKTVCEEIRSAPYDQMSSVELGHEIHHTIAEAAIVCRYTTDVLSEFRKPAFALTEFCERELGADGPGLAAAVIQGFDNESASAGVELGNLADEAATIKELKDCLLDHRYEYLASMGPARHFMETFNSFLTEFGWRPSSWGDLHLPVWAEEPEQALALIGRYMSEPTLSPLFAIQRSQAQRRQAQAEIERRLPHDKKDEFRALASRAQAHVPINESRAHWQLTVLGSLRVPVLSFGQKLVEAGTIQTPDDVFFLYMDELNKAASNPSHVLKGMVSQRRADFMRWQELTPPPFVGAQPTQDTTRSGNANQRLVRDGSSQEPPSVSPGVVKGMGASRGIVRGVARVLRGLEEADRLQPGEVLICTTTAPPWTPLFALAGAVVTEPEVC